LLLARTSERAGEQWRHCPGITAGIDEEIDPVAGSEADAAVARQKRFRRLAVDRHHAHRVARELEEETARCGGVDDPQPQALTGFHGDVRTPRSVDENWRAVGRRRGRENERNVAIDVGRLRVLDDECAGETPIATMLSTVIIRPRTSSAG